MKQHPDQPRADHPSSTALHDLMARCIEGLEATGPAAVDRICAAHPTLAPSVRQNLAELADRGFLRPADRRIGFPSSIGPYRVLGELGSGGMGSVYLAEQLHPVRRRVAVKVIKPGMATREAVHRFGLERQALERMSHPSIAEVFDAGTTDEGHPWFAMEYVPGMGLTDYCDAHRLTTEERLDLFATVCDAVQHAHDKGIIHCDLKPANIMVVSQGGRPAPKVIDFGVAKATNRPRPTTAPARTLLGTPEYMSPEQASGDHLDTRADVYSLGVVLYELLAGSLPFGSRRLRRVSDVEIRRILREEEPPTPSTRISTGCKLSTQTSIARRTNPRSLRRRLRGDLDGVVARAMDKSRSRRYPSARELAADIRRHLTLEPRRAQPVAPLTARPVASGIAS